MSTHYMCIYTVPSEPVSLRYENVTASSIRLFWDPPLQPNGVILDYRVMYIEAVTDITVTMSGIDPMSRTSGLLIDPLMEYHYYDVRVAARTDKGFGNYSQPLTVLTNEHGTNIQCVTRNPYLNPYQPSCPGSPVGRALT